MDHQTNPQGPSTEGSRSSVDHRRCPKSGKLLASRPHVPPPAFRGRPLTPDNSTPASGLPSKAPRSPLPVTRRITAPKNPPVSALQLSLRLASFLAKFPPPMPAHLTAFLKTQNPTYTVLEAALHHPTPAMFRLPSTCDFAIDHPHHAALFANQTAPLALAARYCFPWMLLQLLSHVPRGAWPDGVPMPLESACLFARPSVVRALLGYDSDPAHWTTQLRRAKPTATMAAVMGLVRATTTWQVREVAHVLTLLEKAHMADATPDVVKMAMQRGVYRAWLWEWVLKHSRKDRDGGNAMAAAVALDKAVPWRQQVIRDLVKHAWMVREATVDALMDEGWDWGWRRGLVTNRYRQDKADLEAVRRVRESKRRPPPPYVPKPKMQREVVYENVDENGAIILD
ncbi:hypothetical protein EDC01DRAFT_486791 [Geopyxis carbonaria]|nr:hypothetical protein EDC01DRAFT_486791 [Geopyxis carbonaria]